MAPPLPDELLKMIVEFTTDKSTRCSLLCLSTQFHQLAEPVILQSITIIVRDHRRVRSPLIPFQEFMMSGNGYRCLRVKHFTLSIPVREPSVKEIKILNKLIPKLTALESLSFSMEDHRYVSIKNNTITLFGHLALDSSLKRFRLLIAQYSKAPNLASFLASQSLLECLELPLLQNALDVPPGTVFCNLRYLWAPLPCALELLSSSDGITHFKTYLEDNSPVGSVTESHLDALQMLSCSVSNVDVFASFVSLARNLSFLEVHFEAPLWSAPEGPPVHDILHHLHGTQVQHVRFLLDSPWTASQIYDLFDDDSLVQSLRCIEVKSVWPGDPLHQLCSNFSRSYRYYRGDTQKQPMAVEWKCELGEEWLHDWDRDIHVLPTY